MNIRRMERADAAPLADLIARTLRTTNRADYSPDYLEALIARMTPEWLIEASRRTRFYVACEGGRVIGCGAVGPDEQEGACRLTTVFVSPAHQGRGVGRAILRALEQDGDFLPCGRICLSASITAVGFYEALGYRIEPGVTHPNEEGLLPMEKVRTFES